MSYESGSAAVSSVDIVGVGAAKVSVFCPNSQQEIPSTIQPDISCTIKENLQREPDISCAFKESPQRQIKSMKSPVSSEESDLSMKREYSPAVPRERVIPILSENDSEEDNNKYVKTNTVQSIPIRKPLTEQLVIRNSRIEEMGPQKTRTSPTDLRDQSLNKTSAQEVPNVQSADTRDKITIKIVPVIERKTENNVEYNSAKADEASCDISIEAYSDSSSQEQDSNNDVSRELNYSASEHDTTQDSHSSIDALDEANTESTTVLPGSASTASLVTGGPKAPSAGPKAPSAGPKAPSAGPKAPSTGNIRSANIGPGET